jgi:CBS domain-containing membrane protein
MQKTREKASEAAAAESAQSESTASKSAASESAASESAASESAASESAASESAASESAGSDGKSPESASDAEAPDMQRTSTEVVEVEPEPVRPLPPSLRLKTAPGATSPPMNVTSTLPSATWPPKVVADLMTRKIITIEEHEPIGNLEEWMQQFKFRHLPVVDKEMKFVGLISRTDLLHAELGKKPDGTEAPKFEGDTPAGAIMRKNVVIARLDSPLATACRVMLDKKLTCLPVVLENGRLVGILTETDFVKLSLLLLESRA